MISNYFLLVTQIVRSTQLTSLLNLFKIKPRTTVLLHHLPTNFLHISLMYQVSWLLLHPNSRRINPFEMEFSKY